MSDHQETGTERCERCGEGEVSAKISLGANYDGSMKSEFEICNDCVRSLGEWFEDDGLRADGSGEPGVGCCRVCGKEVGAGYLCSDCDTVEGWP